VADDYDFLLESTWQPPAAAGETGVYVLTLANRGDAAVQGFRLGVSGPARIDENAEITGGSLVHQLSNYAELAPPAGYALAPGGSWRIEVRGLQFPLRHWTDGATAAFVILGDGEAVPAPVRPTENFAVSGPLRRGTMRLGTAQGERMPALALIPWPAEIAVSGRRTPPMGFAIEGNAAAARAFAMLVERLFPGDGLVRSANEGGWPVRLVGGSGMPESYALSWDSGGATVTAAKPAGHLHGLVTLAQMQRGARLEAQRFTFPAEGRISDAPAMGWRGCHLDVARRFYATDEVKQFLALLAWNKLNVFHWHLSDDEAFRVEIEAFPELTRTAGWRGHGLAIPPLLGSGPEPYGGIYRKDAVRDVVAFAAELGITVVPEIDVPGHCHALLQALPQLRDAGENGLYHSIQHFPNNCLNPGVAAVYPALETILGEMLELFPGRHFHIGADEVPADAWASSPQARALSAKLGSSGVAPLQAHFLSRLQAFLTSRGKVTGAWEEAAHGGGIDRNNCYLVGWRDIAASRQLAAAGYDVVVAPGQAYYLDMALSPDWREPGAGWAGWSSPETAYAFDPVAGWSAAERGRLLGVQACIWSEPMSDRAVFDRLVFPRLSAIAETGWTTPGRKDYARFSGIADLMPNLYGQRESAL
jgi:hexosaminidase